MQTYKNLLIQKLSTMKNIYFTIGLLMIALMSNATIIHVDKNPDRPSGYYESLQVAINSASSGDTIFLYPSNSDYGNITIDKQIHLFGFGYDGTTGGVSRIDNLYLDTNATNNTNSSGSSIQGLTMDYLGFQKENIDNIQIIGNYFRDYMNFANNCTNIEVKNNYIWDYVNINNATNVLISNNIFGGGSYNAVLNSSSSTNIITNNLILQHKYFSNVSNATISNNIIICYGDHNQSYSYNNNFINNLSWRSTLNPYPLPPAGNTGSGNISNQDPKFETANSSGNFDRFKDYHLQSSSPGKNAGSDGTDIGPYGGTDPFVWGGAFTIPKVTEVVIETPVVDKGTSVNVKIKAKKAQY